MHSVVVYKELTSIAYTLAFDKRQSKWLQREQQLLSLFFRFSFSLLNVFLIG